MLFKLLLAATGLNISSMLVCADHQLLKKNHCKFVKVMTLFRPAVPLRYSTAGSICCPPYTVFNFIIVDQSTHANVEVLKLSTTFKF